MAATLTGSSFLSYFLLKRATKLVPDYLTYEVPTEQLILPTPPYLPFDMIHKFLLTVHLVTIFFVVISIFLFLSLFF